VNDCFVLEALWKVQQSSWEEWENKHNHFQIWRNTELSNAQKLEVSKKALNYEGRTYGWMKLFPHLGDSLMAKIIGGNPFVFRRLLFQDDYPICSWVWSYAYDSIGIRFGCNPAWADPDISYYSYLRNIKNYNYYGCNKCSYEKGL
jgi:hypothetical protein